MTVFALTAACSLVEGGQTRVVRLGYFPNLTHASAILGIQRGLFAAELAPLRVETTTFQAGPEAVEALLAGAVDAAYLGPNPAINAFARSHGQVAVVSGATSGGAALVVREDINTVEELRGATLATPQIGGTQDVALRNWLAEAGLTTNRWGGGDVSIRPQPNAQAFDAFRRGALDGAWVPEPWVTRFVQEAGARILVDEATLWPDGKYATTLLVVRRNLLEERPGVVEGLVRAQVRANAVLTGERSTAQAEVVNGLAAVTGKRLDPAIVSAAWARLTFTNDPIESSVRAASEHARRIGFPTAEDMDGLFELSILRRETRGFLP